MRKQRYQRSVAESKGPARVNTSTIDQDMRLLNTQLSALKTIWADDEEEAAKKGKSHNAIAQDVKNHQNNSKMWSSSNTTMTEEELTSQFGGQAFLDTKAPLKLALEGNQVELASNIENELMEKYSPEEYHAFILYASENQPVQDISANVRKYAASVSANNYTEDYFSKRELDLNKYMSPEEITQLHVSKYTQKAKDYIDGVALTPENTAQVTVKLAAKINTADLPKKESQALLSHLASKLSKQERQRESIAKAASSKVKSDYISGAVHNIKDYSILTDTDAKTVGNAEFIKNSQDLDDGRMSWSRFTVVPAGERAKDIYTTKLNQKIDKEYRTINATATDSRGIFGYISKEVPADKDLAVELTYNYFNEQRRKNPDFTLDDARSEMYSKTSDHPIRKLVAQTHRRLEELGLTKAEYKDMLKTERGRTNLISRAARKGINLQNTLLTLETLDENTKPNNFTPATN